MGFHKKTGQTGHGFLFLTGTASAVKISFVWFSADLAFGSFVAFVVYYTGESKMLLLLLVIN